MWYWLKNLICGELPLWAFGLECEICQMTFISPEAHYDEVRVNDTEKLHKDRIPKITIK